MYTVKLISYTDNPDKTIDVLFEFSNGTNTVQRTIEGLDTLIDFSESDWLLIFQDFMKRTMKTFKSHATIKNKIDSKVGKIVYSE